MPFSRRLLQVTGDHPLTAEAIARKVGIITERTRREVAADDDVPADRIPMSDPRVQVRTDIPRVCSCARRACWSAFGFNSLNRRRPKCTLTLIWRLAGRFLQKEKIAGALLIIRWATVGYNTTI